QRVTITTARRRRITDLPLLLVRALIVVLAVLAFSRPVVRPKPDAKAARGTRRVVVLLDRSMSMGHLAVWQAAVDSARSIVNALSAGDRVAVIAFDEEATVEQALTLDHATALAAIGRIHPGSLGTRYGAGIRAAREVLTKEAGITGGDVLVVTDLQRSGATGLAGLTLPPAVQLRAVSASPKPHGNTAVNGVTVQRLTGSEAARNRLAVSARIATKGLAAPRKAHVTMLVNGRASGARDLTLPVDGVSSVAFDPVALPVGGVRLTVTVDHDSLPGDDTFNAMVPAQVTRRVILAVPGDVGAEETLYFERAVETGEDPALRIERRNPGALDATTLRDAVAVVLFDVPAPAGSAGTALASWVHDGGGLIGVAGVRLANRPGTTTLLPGTPRGMVDRTESRGGVLGATSLEHPIFSPFRGGGSAPLGSARFFRYPRVTPAADAQVVARFDDGLPALLERQEGTGRVLLTAMPLDATSGDFPIQPTYLPFLRGLVLHAAGNAAVPLWRTAGDGWLVPAAARNPVVKAPSEKLLRPEIGRTTAAVTLDEAGFYTIYEGRPSGDPLSVVAVNVAPRESDLTQMAASEMLIGVGQDTVKASTMAAATLAEAERRQQIWKTLLLLAAVVLVAETLMASRGWRGTAAQIVGTAPDGSAS
ncbi:MAG: VWA domain-containing protein, partial [Gemmatimonadota bacterium]